MTDEQYMKLAIDLARKGRGYVSPNPLVGAVLVKNGKIVGKGYHREFGGPHAEINAIEDAGRHVRGATLYVTLEPCCHEGKTPPCIDTIIKHKIARVVIGTIDSNPLVSCRGIDALRNSGIAVKTGVCKDECHRLNEVFFHYMETGMPFITVKYAQTLDGRIATSTGNSQWISSEASLKYAHQLRAEHDAIMVGRRTVDRDNPELTVRLVRGRNPLRIVVDSGLRVSKKSKLLRHTEHAATLVATAQRPSDRRFKTFSSSAADVISVKADKRGNVDLKCLFKILAKRGISSVLIEGGAQIITSVLKNNMADRLVTVIAPKIIGQGIEAVGDLGIKHLNEAKKLSFQKIMRRGSDMIIDSRFV